MNIEHILATHDEQEPRVALVTNIVRRLLADCDAIDARQYLPRKADALKQERHSQAEREIVDESRRLDQAQDERTDAEVAAAAEAERTRLRERPNPVIDAHRITVARTAPEVGVVLTEAETLSPHELRRVWPFAKSRLEEMERAEFHRHVLPNAASASAVKLRWQVRVADIGRRAPDETAIRERGRQEKAALQSRVLMIAGLVGLGGAVQRAAVRAEAPVLPQDGTFVIGRFWQQHPELKGR